MVRWAKALGGCGQPDSYEAGGRFACSMERNWNRLIAYLAERGGVGTPADARANGVPEATWHRRTRHEQWARPCLGVRVAPWAPTGRVTDLRAAIAACRGLGVAAGRTALWLDDLADEPHVLEVVVPDGVRIPGSLPPRTRVRGARWLTPGDAQVVDHLPRLRPEALVVSLARVGRSALQAAVIDLVQAGRTTPDRVLERLATVGPIRGRGDLEAVLLDLGGKRPESWFHDIVLTELEHRGYPAERHPAAIDTPDGRGVSTDISIAAFQVGMDLQGDRYHRSRRARRNDRRRIAQVAGTTWVFTPVDWRDWHLRREWVFETLDAAILRQFRAGIGTAADLPPHLRTTALPRRKAG